MRAPAEPARPRPTPRRASPPELPALAPVDTHRRHRYVPFNHPYHEEPEIWVPDITPYNVREGLTETMTGASARVNASGNVYWSRPGIVDVMCKFSGLVNFPRDELKCGLELGGWMISGAQQGVLPLDGGYDFSSQEATAGSSYQENWIQNVTVLQKM